MQQLRSAFNFSHTRIHPSECFLSGFVMVERPDATLPKLDLPQFLLRYDCLSIKNESGWKSGSISRTLRKSAIEQPIKVMVSYVYFENR